MDTNSEDLVQGLKINGHLIITKLEAARRQLESAIFLYFEEKDPVSIHTLTAAAYNILRDISAKRNLSPMMVKGFFYNALSRNIKRKCGMKLKTQKTFLNMLTMTLSEL